MTTVELRRPAMPDLDLTIARAMPVTNHEMIGQAIFHVAHPEMVDVEDTGISLARAAVVNDDIFPATASHMGMINRCTGRSTQIGVGTLRATAKEPTKKSG
jgi:hypothetical protein